MRTTCLLAFIAALAVTAPELSALAQQPPSKAAQAEASSRFKKGSELYSEDDYQAALIEFRRAYELAPNPVVLYNIGKVYYQLQDYPNALTYLERYLAEGGKSIAPARRTEVERDVEKLKSRVAGLDITVNVPDAEISIDDQSVGKSPLAKPVMVGPGRHRISVFKSGYTSATRVIEVASAETPKLPFELTEQASTPTAEPPAPKGDTSNGANNTVPPPVLQPAPPPGRGDVAPPLPPKKVTVWPGWAVTGLLAVGAGATGAIALLASNDLKGLRATVPVTQDKLDTAASRAKTFAVVSDILSGAAVIAGGVSLYLTLSNRSEGKPEPAAKTGYESERHPAPELALGLCAGGVRLFGSF